MTARSASVYRLDWLPSLVAAAFMLATSATGFFLPLFFRDVLDFSGSEIGILVAVQALTGLLCVLPAGWFNDRMTSRALLVFGLVGQGGGLALMAQARDFLPELAGMFLWSLANNLCRLSLDVQILKSPSASPIQGRLSRYQGARFAGITVGTILAGAVLLRYPFDLVLEVSAVISLALVPLSLALAPTPAGRMRLSDYRADLRDGRVLRFAAFAFLFCSHWGAEGTAYPLYLKDGLRLDLGEIGAYMAAEYACVLLAVILSAPLFSRRQRVLPLLVIGLALSGIGQAGLASAAMPVSLVFRMLHGLGDGVVLLFFYLGIHAFFPRERLGGHTGFVTAVTMAGYIAGALVYGPLGERCRYEVPLWASGAINLLLIALLVWSQRRFDDVAT